MKYFLPLLAAGITLSAPACADEFVQMSNGMTCWRNAHGVLWGCSGGVPTSNGVEDPRTGQHYPALSPNQALDPRTGQTLGTPGPQGVDEESRDATTHGESR